jgi:chromosome segregation protein
MYLKQLDILGFKSFPDRVSLMFKPGMTAVVGPNGSGKSNIADALRWVMGETSAKTLRGAKMEDVIFSGTAHRKPLGYAEIVMHMDNADRQLNIDFANVSVARRVYRSGESEYHLNGAACRLKDIQQLFMDTGVGRDGYSIIGQGRIDEILSVRSEDRRLLFEEAAGIVKYKTRRNDALQKLEREKANRERVDDIITELDTQLAPLSEQSERAKTYLNLREQYKSIHINIFLEEAQRTQAETERLDKQLADLKAQAEQGRAALTAARIEGEGLKAGAVSAAARIKLANEKILELTTVAAKKENETQLLEASGRGIEANRVRFENEAAKRGEAIAAKQAERETEEAARVKASEELDALNGRLAEQQGGFDELDEAVRRREVTLSGHNQQIQQQITISAELKSRLREAENNYNRLEDDKERLNSEILHIETTLEDEEAKQQSRVAALKTGEEDTARQKETAEQVNRARITLSEECNRLAETLRVIQADWHSVSSRYRALKELEAHHEGYYHSVKAVLSRKDSDAKFKGICGAVGELIGVPVKYEAAIETALGGAAQNIVARTEEDAQLAIEMLKATKAGRATFLPLTAVKGRSFDAARNGVNSELGYIGVAVDLISFDNEYADVMSNLLGNVIVIDTLKNAVSLQKKYRYAYKAVTLEGDLLSPGGAMTGGSRQTQSAGLLGRSRQLAELADKTRASRQELDKLERQLQDARGKLSATEEALQRARDGYQELLIEQNNLRNQVAQSEEKIKSLRASAEASEAQNERLMGTLVETNKAIRELKRECVAQDANIEAARRKLSDYQQEIADERARQSEQTAALTALRVEIGRKTEALNTLSQSIFRIEKEHGALISEKSLLLKEVSQAEAALEKNRADIEAARALRLEWDERLNAQRLELEAAEKERASLDGSIFQSDADISTYQEDNARVEKEIARLETRREQFEADNRRLYDEIWDEYGLTFQTALPFKTAGVNPAALKRDGQRLKAELSAMTDVNVGAIEQYRALNERHGFLTAQRDDIIKAEETLGELIAELTSQMEERFADQFTQIDRHFNDVFREMFNGGQAGLKLLNEKNLLESGIEITAQPPGKALQTLSLLSGGERALTAIALLFAILRLKPSPFCVLDEIEAALDDANVARFASFIRRYSEGTQFIIITHRKGTMEAADTLYGVTMQEQGISKLVSVRLVEEAV